LSKFSFLILIKTIVNYTIYPVLLPKENIIFSKLPEQYSNIYKEKTYPDQGTLIQEPADLDNNKLINRESFHEIERKSEGFLSSPTNSFKKRRKSKKITACPHISKNHYAKVNLLF